MTPFLQLSLALAIIIAAAKAGGYLSYKLGQPSVLGELLVGIILGPTVLDLLHNPYFTDKHLPEVIHEMAEVGVSLLMFLAGLELHLSDLAKSRRVAVLSGVIGVLLPLGLGTALQLFFPMSMNEAIFLGLILAATSVSISAQTLMELRVLNSRVGIGLLGAAVLDDILVVLGLSVFTALVIADSDAGLLNILFIALRMVLFLGVSIILGMRLLPRWTRKIDNLPISQGIISFSVVMILLYGWASETLGGMAAITGAFAAGLVFGRSPIRERIQSGISSLAYGMFVPVFFIDVGLQTNARELGGEIFWLFLAMTIVAIIGKVLGAGTGAILSGFSRREAMQLGIGMMSRGEVGLIVATIGIKQGLIPQSLFSAVVGVVIITTLLTPPLLRASFQKSAKAAKENIGEKTKNSSSEGET
jgi:Kef-type K+ transport system membrane component KefB